MTQTLEITATWRKTKRGEWVAFGNAEDLKAALDNDLPITMVRKDGSTQTRDITKVGRAFAVNGVAMCYGYLRPEDRRTTGKNMPGWAKMQAATRNSGKARSGGRCDECGGFSKTRVPAHDMSGLAGMVCTRCKHDEGSLSFA